MDGFWVTLILLVMFCVCALLALFGDYRTKKEKSLDAAAYANWLQERYPSLGPVEAAELRISEISQSQFLLTSKQKEEVRRADLVIAGWHEWTGAQV